MCPLWLTDDQGSFYIVNIIAPCCRGAEVCFVIFFISREFRLDLETRKKNFQDSYVNGKLCIYSLLLQFFFFDSQVKRVVCIIWKEA